MTKWPCEGLKELNMPSASLRGFAVLLPSVMKRVLYINLILVIVSMHFTKDQPAQRWQDMRGEGEGELQEWRPSDLNWGLCGSCASCACLC